MADKLLGTNLRYLRKKNNYIQSDMQDICGITGATWSNYENSVSEPDIYKLLEISNIFGVTVEDILTADLENVQGNDNKEGLNKHGKNTVKNTGNEPGKSKNYSENNLQSDLNDPQNLYTWVIAGLLQKMDVKLDGLRILMENQANQKP